MREKCARAEEDARGQGEYFSSLLGNLIAPIGALAKLGEFLFKLKGAA